MVTLGRREGTSLIFTHGDIPSQVVLYDHKRRVSKQVCDGGMGYECFLTISITLSAILASTRSRSLFV